MIHRFGIHNLCRQWVIKYYSSCGHPWGRCRSVAELLGALSDIPHVDATAKESIERTAKELASDNLKEAAMLIIALNNFGCEVKGILSNVNITKKNEDLDLLFRAISECGLNVPPNAETEIRDSANAAENPRQLYNYLCGGCTYKEQPCVVDIEALLSKIETAGVSSFTSIQLLHMAKALAELNPEAYNSSIDMLCTALVHTCLENMHISDLLEGIAKLSRNYLNHLLAEALEKKLLSHYSDSFLSPDDLCDAVYTFSRYRGCNSLLMDRIAVNLRRDIGNYDLTKLARVAIGLSQIGYYNKAIVILLGKMVKTFLDKDSTAQAQLLTNLYTGFSRFLYNDKLFDLFSTIIRKEEVFCDVQPSDAVAIVQAYARVRQVDEQLFSLFDNKLFHQPMNTSLSVKLLVAHGKLHYLNPRLQNALINNINLNEIESNMEKEKLKLAVERLALFFPELVGDGDSELPSITWRRLDPERRKMQHVRRRKWTW